jgi:type II secretory pathway pseudopilin PulG
MRLSPVNNTANQGFTLLENLTIVLILGIAAAVGSSSFLAMQQRQRLLMATDLVRAAMQEAQQTSIERSTVCSLKIGLTAIVDNNNCLQNRTLSLPSGITMRSAGLDDSIEYGSKGNTVDNRTIRLSTNGNATSGRCLTISAPLGIMRQGYYNNPEQPCQSKNS